MKHTLKLTVGLSYLFFFSFVSMLSGQRKDSLFLEQGFSIPDSLLERELDKAVNLEDLLAKAESPVAKLKQMAKGKVEVDSSALAIQDYLFRVANLNQQGLAAFQQGDFKKAKLYMTAMHEAAVRIYQKKLLSATESMDLMGNGFGLQLLGTIFVNLSALYMEEGSRQKAIQYKSKAKDFYEHYVNHLQGLGQTVPYRSIDLNAYHFTKAERYTHITHYLKEIGRKPPTNMFDKLDAYLTLASTHLPNKITTLKKSEQYDEAIICLWLIRDLWLSIFNDKSMKPIIGQILQLLMPDAPQDKFAEVFAWQATKTAYKMASKWSFKTNKPDLGAAYFKQFLTIELNLMRQNLAFIYYSLSNDYTNLNHYEFILKYMELGDQTFAKIDKTRIIIENSQVGSPQTDTKNELAGLLNITSIPIANYFINIMQPDKARDMLKSHIDTILTYGGDLKDVIQLNDELAYAYSELDQLDKAFELLRNNRKLLHGKKIDKRHYSNALSLGIHYMSTDQLDSCQYYLEEAVKCAEALNDEKELADVRELLAGLKLINGDHKDASKMFSLNTTIFKKFKKTGALSDNQNFIGLLQFINGNHEVALEAFEQAIEVFEKDIDAWFRGGMSKRLLRQNYYSTYAMMIKTALTLKKKDKAFNYIEKIKSRTLVEQLTERDLNLKKIGDSTYIHQEQVIFRQIQDYWLKKQTSHNEKQKKLYDSKAKALLPKLDLLKAELSEKHPRYAALKYPAATTISEVQKQLATNEVLVQYYLELDDAYVFVIHEDKDTIIKLRNPFMIKKYVRDLRQKFIVPLQEEGDEVSRPNARFYPIAHNLYKYLIAPIEAAGWITPQQSELIVVPMGRLYYLPFELLVKNPTYKENFTDHHYLVQDYPIVYYPSSTTFYIERKHKKQTPQYTKDIFLVGDPLFENRKEFKIDSSGLWTLRSKNTRKFRPLKGTKKEVKNIAALYDNATVLMQEQATEENCKQHDLSQYRYIHFATHGILEDDEPNFSGIVLTQDKNAVEDGILYVYELMNMNFEADLVVASVCEAGLGRLERGEGLVGLSRSLMYAGTPSVIASLWSVNDISTSDLFIKYHQYLKTDDGKNKYNALRKVQLEMIKDDAMTPYHWAPFIFIGASK